MNNYVSVFNKQLITSGISSTTGRYFDRKMDRARKIVHVYDENTSNKKNVDIDKNHGFTKPQNTPSPEPPDDWSTAIIAVPQLNAGELGIPYKDYIDGRARNDFVNMLNMVMRLKIRVVGEPSHDLADSHNLGTSKLKIAWKVADLDGDDSYFLDGDWLVYGFQHIVTREKWYTDIYCSRLDWDASAKKV